MRPPMRGPNISVSAIAALTVIVTVLLQACGLVPQKVSMDDPPVQRLLKAAASFDRTSYGFSPIPTQADVRLELRPTSRYDAMLHIRAKTVRTIAFRKDHGNYVWVGEQETFDGPKKYKTLDGTFNEAITLTYEIQSISGYPLNQLNVTYRGEDARLIGRTDLSLATVKPILKEWSY
jgi:hypothetical protein